MKPLLLLAVILSSATAALAVAPTQVTTTKKSAIAIGSGSFALVKGTKLEVVAREGDTLIVKFRSSQGKILLADTDYPEEAPSKTVEPSPAVIAAPATPSPVVSKPATATIAKPALPPPPALSVDGKPATHYGKAVQKAKQVTEAHQSTHVDPTKGIMDDDPKK